MLIGIWHGANSRYIGFGLWNGLIIMISALIGPVYDRTRTALHIKENAAWWQLFQMLRTFVIVLVGYVFDIAENFTNALQMIWLTLTDQSLSVFREQLPSLMLVKEEYAAILICTLVLLYFSIRMEKESVDTPAEIIVRHRGFIQWAALFLLLLCILVAGYYGPMADPADFIYMQF